MNATRIERIAKAKRVVIEAKTARGMAKAKIIGKRRTWVEGTILIVLSCTV